MDTITVLRLEDANGGGCFEVACMQDYTDAAVAAGLMSSEEDSYAHFHEAKRGCPGPANDAGLIEAFAALPHLDPWRGTGASARFGFVDEGQAREWFPDCMADALRANGQTLTRWEVPANQVAIGDRQVVFNRDAATLLERLPVEALYEPARQFTLPLAA